MTDTAVLIFGWNRPHYMQKMLQSVSKNKKLDTYVFLDQYKDIKITYQLLQLCKKYIPHAEVKLRQKRYGCENNIDNARFWAFNKGYKRIIVLEDDFVISKNYFQLLENALDWCQKYYPSICCIIGWTGKDYKTYQNFQYQPYKLSFSRLHLLGYILSKTGWQKMLPYYSQYMELTNNCLIDYSHSKLMELRQFFRCLPVNINMSEQWKNKFRNQPCYGQDRATISCMYAAGIHRANFDLSRLEYIGYVGLHANLQDSINFGWSNIKKTELDSDATNKQFQIDQQFKKYL